MRALISAVALSLLALPAAAQTNEHALAASAAAELESLCRADGGRLWGASLCGPLIVVNPSTREAWATVRDNEGVFTLTPSGGWIGVLPQGVPIANTTVKWGGQRWIMVMGPLPADVIERRALIMHEAWHRAQESIGLPMQNTSAAHLETERGRYLMRLEMRALSTAMLSTGRARRNAAKDALAFRAERLASFPEAQAAEAGLDRNEGLASYTGIKLGVSEDLAPVFAARTLTAYDDHDALARSYAYATGPAYGLLLDEYLPNWRSTLAAWAPADLLVSPIRAQLLNARALQRQADRYGGAQIAAQERDRAEQQRQLIAGLRARFAEGPRLVLPLAQMQFEFDPNGVTPVEGLGTVYQTLTIRDAWGELRANDGALISPNFDQLTASSPGPGGLSGRGWALTLAPGYRIGGPDAQGVIRPEPITAPPPATPHPDN